MNEIPERAAWLDHPVEFVHEVSLFEMERLGLDHADVVLKDQQTTIDYNPGDGNAIIVVRDIRIVSMDQVNRQLSYRVVGSHNLVQPWDLGGAHLASREEEIGAAGM